MDKGAFEILGGQAPHPIHILLVDGIPFLTVLNTPFMPFQGHIRACVMGCIHPGTFGQRHGAAGRVAVLLERYLP